MWRREEALRPCPVLGYDHDELAQYLMTRKAWKLAEDEFRRAIWLNPFEPLFKEHLALCFLEQKRYDQALGQAEEILKDEPDRQSARTLHRTIQREIEENARKHNAPGNV